MPNLVDVLNLSKGRKEVADLGMLDTEIPLNLQALSAIVEKEFQSGGLYFYSNALSNFCQGFGDGTRNSQHEAGMPDSYNLGYNLGTSLAHPPAGMEDSYTRAKGQWLIVIPTLRKEIGVLAEIQKNPLKFILDYIRKNNIEHEQIAQGLSDIFNYDSEWTEKILRETVPLQMIDALERKDGVFRQNIWLGVYYLINGEPTMAHVRLREAFQKSEESPLGEALRHVYPNTLEAYNILKPAHEKVKVAGRFGTEQLAA